MKVICVRLITGEEVIGKIHPRPSMLNGNNQQTSFDGEVWRIPENDDAKVIIEDARIVAMQQTPQGVGISFIPFSLANPMCKIELDLRKHAMAVYPPEENLRQAYCGNEPAQETANGLIAKPTVGDMQALKLKK